VIRVLLHPIEYVEKFGFKVESILCSGYYPLPNWFAKIDPRHGHFITIKARKIAEFPIPKQVEFD
jgi:hypothetical protein